VSTNFDLGVHYFLRGEYETAVKIFQEIARDDPTHARVWQYYGMTLAHLGQGAQAEAALSRAVQLAPQNAQAWFHLGVARALREEWPDAASAYQKAVALEPNDLVAWHRLGVALAESGNEPAATTAFERALVLSRESDDPTRETPEAVHPEAVDEHLVETGEREGGREAKSWIDLALSLLSLGEEEEAVAAYERAYSLDPGRASRSLFRPMLHLVTAAQPDPSISGAFAPGDEDDGPQPPKPRTPFLDDDPEEDADDYEPPPESGPRPEVG
jgi:Flp pilus assembly protein TadD